MFTTGQIGIVLMGDLVELQMDGTIQISSDQMS